MSHSGGEGNNSDDDTSSLDGEDALDALIVGTKNLGTAPSVRKA